MRELRGLGYEVGRGHVSQLMKIMGIHAIYRRPRTTTPDIKHKVYPCLLEASPSTGPIMPGYPAYATFR